MDLKCFVALLEVLDWEIVKSMPLTPGGKTAPSKAYEWGQWLKARIFIAAALHCLECVQDGAESEGRKCE